MGVLTSTINSEEFNAGNVNNGFQNVVLAIKMDKTG